MSTGQPKEIATTSREPANAILVVDSNDQQKFDSQGFRIDSSTPGRIFINGQRPLLTGYMTRLALTEMNIQWDTPNVNSSNNTLTVRFYSATDVTPPVVTSLGFVRLIIPPKFYTPLELATEIQNQFAIGALGGLTFTCVYDQDECSFTITQTATHPSGNTLGYFKIYSGTAPQSITGEPKLKDDILFCIGLQAKNQPGPEPIGFYSVITGGFAPMLYTPYVDVVSNQLTKNQNVADGTTGDYHTASKLCRIYFSNEDIAKRQDEAGSEICNIPGTQPCIFRREFSTPKQIQWNNTENVDFIDIQVLDRLGNEVILEEEFLFTGAPDNVVSFRQANNTSFQFTLYATEA